jgi:hypothetical protein
MYGGTETRSGAAAAQAIRAHVEADGAAESATQENRTALDALG